MSGGKLPQIEEEDVYKVTIPIEALASDGGQKSIQEGIQKSILIYRIKPDVICLYYFNEISSLLILLILAWPLWSSPKSYIHNGRKTIYLSLAHMSDEGF